jgi:imidazolonepropionase-like amidohydrolase
VGDGGTEDDSHLRRCRTLPLLALLVLTSCAPGQPVTDPMDLFIDDVTIVDVTTGRTHPHSRVAISASRIVGVGSIGDVPAPPRAKRIDGRGLFLIPGLWDMHTHSLWGPEAVRTFLPAYVANGVTGIRDMGGRLDIMRAVRDSIRSGLALVPRIHAAGVILDGPEPVDPSISISISDPAGAIAAVDSLTRAGVDFIKVYTLLPRDAFFAVIAEAARLGLPVAGHIPYEVTAAEAAGAGQRSIEHLNDEMEPFCTPDAPEPCAELFELFRRHGTWQVPTLIALRMKAQADDSAFAADPRMAYIPATLRAAWLREREQKLSRGPDYFPGKRKRYQAELWLTGRLRTEKVPMMAGSDAGVAFSYPGFSLHEELGLLAEAGFSNLEALQAATLRPAQFLAATDSLGSIEVGKVADLVLLRANPLEDIRATREIETVVLRGHVIDRAGLDSLLAGVARAAQ